MSKAIYCTYLTIYYGNLLPKRYIGYTTVKKIQKGYNGSVQSKLYKSIYDQEQKVNKHLFRTRILSTFSSKDEAILEEQRLHIKYNVVKNPNYMNESRAFGPIGIYRDQAGENNPMYGVIRPDEWREEHSNFMKGNTYGSREWTEEEKLNKSFEAKERSKIKCCCLLCSKVLSYYQLNQHYESCSSDEPITKFKLKEKYSIKSSCINCHQLYSSSFMNYHYSKCIKKSPN
jgi:hypothetical protein